MRIKKSFKQILTGTVVVALAAAATSLAAADYSVRWYTIAGGGGASGGGSYSANGTTGQPLVGPTAGVGAFAFTGGFWAAIGSAPPRLGPPLTTRLQWEKIVISWPVSAEGYVLQETFQLTGPNGAPWFNSRLPVIVENGQNLAIAGIVGEKIVGEKGLSARFFRLAKP